jgi:histidinol-phosphate/aromatic aminotransferase/cobyric acid decarboxylase-like protein
VGYAVCSSQRTASLVSTLELPYAVATASARAAQAALEDTAHAAAQRAEVARERERCLEWLRMRGLGHIGSQSCFVMVQLPVDAEAVLDAMQARAIFLPRAVYFDRCILLPLARPDQNDRVWQALDQVLAELRDGGSQRA